MSIKPLENKPEHGETRHIDCEIDGCPGYSERYSEYTEEWEPEYTCSTDCHHPDCPNRKGTDENENA
ncbi:MAG: hypothetical protein ACU837_10690 [Gammaproteobacteria bacterium]